MMSNPIVIGAEHERHTMSREIVAESAAVFSCTSIPRAVANRVMTAVPFSLAQHKIQCGPGWTYLDIHDKVSRRPLILIPLLRNRAYVVGRLAEGEALVSGCLSPGLRASGAYEPRRYPVNRVGNCFRWWPLRISESL